MNDLQNLLKQVEDAKPMTKVPADIIEQLTNSIDVEEFFGPDDDKDVRRMSVDQLRNLPSLIASKNNIEALNINAIHPNDAGTAHECASRNTMNIMRNMLIGGIRDNLHRFFKYHCNTTRVFMDYDRKKSNNDYMNDPEYILTKYILENFVDIDVAYPSINDILYNMFLIIPPLNSSYDHMQGQYGEMMIQRAMDWMTIIINQLHTFIASQICAGLDDYFYRIFWSDGYDKDGLLEFMRHNNKQNYQIIMNTFAAYPYEGLLLSIRQSASCEINEWFYQVLYPLIQQIVENSYRTNYFIFYDYMRDANDRKLEKQN